MLEVDDLYTSPVPTKIMNTLRHTKSEENLGADTSSLSAFSMCGIMCDDNDPDWSQEDDEISQQVNEQFVLYIRKVSAGGFTAKMNCIIIRFWQEV